MEGSLVLFFLFSDIQKATTPLTEHGYFSHLFHTGMSWSFISHGIFHILVSSSPEASNVFYLVVTLRSFTRVTNTLYQLLHLPGNSV